MNLFIEYQIYAIIHFMFDSPCIMNRVNSESYYCPTGLRIFIVALECN